MSASSGRNSVVAAIVAIVVPLQFSSDMAWTTTARPRPSTTSSAATMGPSTSEPMNATTLDTSGSYESSSVRTGNDASVYIAGALQDPTQLQQCGIDGRVFDATVPAANIPVQLFERTVSGSGPPPVVRDTVLTDTAGRYHFTAARPPRPGYVYSVQFMKGVGDTARHLQYWFAEDVGTLSSDGCAAGGDFDIVDVELVSPDVDSHAIWGTPFTWKRRLTDPQIVGSEQYQICFAGWPLTSTLAQVCIPVSSVGGETYVPQASDRPRALRDNVKYQWFIKVVGPGTSYGYSSLVGRPITFVSLPTGGAPTATEMPTATPTPYPTPRANSRSLCPGDSVTDTLPVRIAAPPRSADILLALDATYSMRDVISSATTNAVSIVDAVEKIIPGAHFGVIAVRDYPVEFELLQSITPDRNAIRTALSGIVAGNKGTTNNDRPEAYARALWESYQNDSGIGWRNDTRRIVLMFGDEVPHDDDLNAGIATPLMSAPSGPWCGEPNDPSSPYPKCALDPGRNQVLDGVDDIDFQLTLDEMRQRNMTLLFVVTSADRDWARIMKHYWHQWARRTSYAGEAVELSNNLTGLIADTIERATMRINSLSIGISPSYYEGWFSFEQRTYQNVAVQPSGTTVPFTYTLSVPPNEGIGVNHAITLTVVGDGFEYGMDSIHVYSPPSICIPPATQPSPGNFLMGLPLVSNLHFRNVYDGPGRSHVRVGPAGGEAVSGVQIQNLDRQQPAEPALYFSAQQMPHIYPPISPPLAPRPFDVRLRPLDPGGSANKYIRSIGIPIGAFSAFAIDSVGRPVAAIARTDWQSGGAVLYSNVSPSYELSIPVILRDRGGQTSLISVMNYGNDRAVDVEMSFYDNSGSGKMVSVTQFTLLENQSTTFDLLDNVPVFNDLGPGFLGSARLRLVYGRGQTDTGARIGAVSFVNMASSKLAIWGFEAIPTGLDNSEAASELYVPLWRSRQKGRLPDGRPVTFDTGIAIMNPNDHAVLVSVDFSPTDHSNYPLSCTQSPVVTIGPLSIGPLTSRVLYQGPGPEGDLLPRNCFGSAVIRTSVATDRVIAIVNDAQDGDDLAAAYSAIPRQRASRLVAIPLFRNNHTAQRSTTGIQVMNVSQEVARVRADFYDDVTGHVAGCRDACVASIPPMKSHTWWPPEVDALRSSAFGSAMISSTQSVAVIVNDYPLSSSVDEATYNGIPVRYTPVPAATRVP